MSVDFDDEYGVVYDWLIKTNAPDDVIESFKYVTGVIEK